MVEYQITLSTLFAVHRAKLPHVTANWLHRHWRLRRVLYHMAQPIPVPCAQQKSV